MISIIICSIDPVLLAAVKENISATIGIPFEIIATDNRNSTKGICEVYNDSVAYARYELLCFVHEDIVISTQDWGKTLVRLFKDPKLGLVGVAGSNYRPLTPSAWAGIGPKTVYQNIIQAHKFKKADDALHYLNPKKEKLAKVACVDGVWLTTTKTIASAIKFDQDTFKGFHVYDVDFSMSVAQSYTVAVTFEILIKHLSEGRYDQAWMADNLKFSEKWHSKLPLSVGEHAPELLMSGEKSTFKHFIEQLIQFGFPMQVAYNVLWRNNQFFNSYGKLFFKLNYYIFIKYVLKRRRNMA
ncbi:glycosyltransferase [Mucilaginibacter psychrotolerans]|uniref:Streptomycin biosynthesis protein StrF domain-containing protein n=1 Tax=Mucilaginibacter psychrotolerans TaxID=1524096 RepID=A0A4Y8S5M4_9SPHI|nr:glycosyltransferase [Mucilaginibacter psychrotolerans]TFF33704.1 hypothetical protein E2R66_24850 [Mucilaginibacter psychrotolerans]